MPRNRFHTTTQPDSDVTAFFLSCDRLDLLSRTITSFLATSQDYPTRKIILDDSAHPEVFRQLVGQYGKDFDVVCLAENRGIQAAQDFMISYCFTPYIFYIEDDWLFLKPGYLALSKRILETHRDIGLIDLSDNPLNRLIGTQYHLLGDETEDFIYKKPWRISNAHYWWIGYCGAPNLKRRVDLVRLGRHEATCAEWHIDRLFALNGLKCVYSKEVYATHIGDGRSVMDSKRRQETLTPDDIWPVPPHAQMPRIDWHFMERQAPET